MATANPVATELMVATDISYTNLLKHYNGTYVTQLPTTAGELTKGVQLYSKMRHEDDVMGWSDWSTDVTFQIAQYLRQFSVFGDDNYTGNTSKSFFIKDSNGDMYLVSIDTDSAPAIIYKLNDDLSLIKSAIIGQSTDSLINPTTWNSDLVILSNIYIL